MTGVRFTKAETMPSLFRKGVLAVCSQGHVGVITEDKPVPVTYDDGTEGVAWVGLHVLPLELFGTPWSSRSPRTYHPSTSRSG